MTANQTEGRNRNKRTARDPDRAAVEVLDFARDQPVNPADSWRLICPEGHCPLYWMSPETVECVTCRAQGADAYYALEEIEDQVTGDSLEQIANRGVVRAA